MINRNLSLITANILLAGSLSAVELNTHLESTKTYDINGTFASYDFAEAEAAFDWAFVMANGTAFQLQGIAPTETSVFGWKAVDVNPTITSSSWNMIYLEDWDQDGDTKFDWVLIKNELETSLIYKLGGANENGNFIYEKIDGLTATTTDSKIEFKSDGTIVVEKPDETPKEDNNSSTQPEATDKDPYESEILLPGVTIIENSKNMQEPLKGALIYDKDGKDTGLKTDKFGNISFTDLKSKGIKDGDIISISKKGYQTVKVKVATSGEILPISKSIKGNLEVKLKDGGINSDFNVVQKKTYTASAKTINVQFDITALKDVGDVTVSTIPVESSNDIKIDNDINISGASISPSQLSVVGGAMFSTKNDKQEPVSVGQIDGLNLKIKQISFLGDLEKILNGLTNKEALKSKATELSEETYTQLQNAIEKDFLSFYVIQKDIDGVEWEYKAEAELQTFTKNGQTHYLMVPKGDISFDRFEDIAFVLKTEKLSGNVNICVYTKEWKYPDGSLVSMDEEKSLKNAIINGDNNVITQWTRTAADGCKEIEYTVPFLSPTFAINVDKEHFFNTTRMVDIEAGKVTGETVDVYLQKRPPYGSVWGYVLDKTTEAGLPGAMVELRDPQILTKDRVKFDGKRVKLPYNEDFSDTVTYEWKLQKDGKNLKTLKNGKGRENAVMDTKTILDEIITPYESGNNLDINPLGQYTIAIKVTVIKSNTTTTEEALIDFSLLMDEYAVKLRTSFSVNQGEAGIFKTEDNSDVTVTDGQAYDGDDKKINGLVSYSVYGGKDLGYWYAMSDAANSYDADSHSWTVTVAGATGSDYDSSSCVDVTHEPALQGGMFDDDTCVVEIISPADKLESKAEYTNAYLMSYINKNFNNLLKPDVHPDANGMPYLLSGFNYYLTYHRDVTVGGNKYYSDIPSTHYLNAKGDGGFDNIREAVRFGDVTMHLNDALGFRTLTTISSDEKMGDDNKLGYYEFMYAFPPSVSEKLELRTKAAGYKIGSENLIQLDFIDEYQKRRYDFKLTPAGVPDVGDNDDANKPDVVHNNAIWFGFEKEDKISDYGWSVESIYDFYTGVDIMSPTVSWNIVNNSNLPLTNEYYKNSVVEDSTVTSILPAADGEKYAWFGNSETGTYTDNSDGSDSTMPVGKFLVSPVIDFSNIPLAKATVKAWYEVSGDDSIVDAAIIGFILPISEYSEATVNLDWARGSQSEIKVGIAYMRKVSPSTVDILPGQNDISQVSNTGTMSAPEWQTYELPLDILAGKKAQLVFGFMSSDEKNNNLRGFGVDSILIEDDVATIDEETAIVDCLPGEDCSQDIMDDADDTTFKPVDCLPGQSCS